MDQVYTRKEAAQILGIGLTALDSARMKGKISYIQYAPNGSIYFTDACLKEYVARCTHKAKPEEKIETYRRPRTQKR